MGKTLKIFGFLQIISLLAHIKNNYQKHKMCSGIEKLSENDQIAIKIFLIF